MDSEHTTPAQGQLHATLARVKDLLARIDSEPDSYTAKPRLTAPDLAAWEAANGVSLPEAYRLFLLEIGNGGMMPGSYCDFKMWPLDPTKVDAQLREPFPISKDRFEQRMARLRTEGRGDDPFLFPELSEYWEEGWPPGCLRLGHYPSYDSVYLVVSGDLYGMVWCAVDGGVPELDQQGKPFDFLGWFEDVLLEMIGAK
jgi:hypothetical protein